MVTDGCDFLPVSTGHLSFNPLGGTNASLKPLDKNPSVTVTGDTSGPIQLLDSSLSVWDANLYQLTTQDGTKYIISRTGGLQSMTDLNGNKLTIDNSGIHYGNGGSVITDLTT